MSFFPNWIFLKPCSISTLTSSLYFVCRHGRFFFNMTWNFLQFYHRYTKGIPNQSQLAELCDYVKMKLIEITRKILLIVLFNICFGKKSSILQNIEVAMNNFFVCFNIFQQTFHQIIPKSIPHNILKFYVKVLNNDELDLLLVRTHAELHYHFSVKPVFIDLYAIFSFTAPKVFLVIRNDKRIFRRTKLFSFRIRWTHSTVKISIIVEK